MAAAAGEKRHLSMRTVQPEGQSAPNNNNFRYKKSHDPSLDNIVAKLKTGLSLGAFKPSEKEKDVSAPDGGCSLCDRPIKLVLCKLCGNTTTGRIAAPCPAHPRRLFLQDLTKCPACENADLDNLKEFELPEGMKECVKNFQKIN